MLRTYLGFGANLGDRLGMLRAGLRALVGTPGVAIDWHGGIASLYETEPVDVPTPQPPYLNSVVRVQTTLTPVALLEAAFAIEAGLGRVRSGRYEPRTIDVDLLLYEDLVISDAALTIPHPRLAERRFVLEPLAEIAGELIHPTLCLPIRTLAERLRASDSPQRIIRIAGPEWLAAPV